MSYFLSTYEYETRVVMSTYILFIKMAKTEKCDYGANECHDTLLVKWQGVDSL